MNSPGYDDWGSDYTGPFPPAWDGHATREGIGQPTGRWADGNRLGEGSGKDQRAGSASPSGEPPFAQSKAAQS